MLAQNTVGHGPAVAGVDESGVEADCFVEILDGPLVLVDLPIRAAPTEEGCRVLGIEPDRPGEVVDSLADPTYLLVGDAPEVVGTLEGWAEPDTLGIVLHGHLSLSHLHQVLGTAIVRFVHSGVTADGLAVVFDGRIQLTQRPVDTGPPVVGIGVLGVEGYGLVTLGNRLGHLAGRQEGLGFLHVLPGTPVPGPLPRCFVEAGHPVGGGPGQAVADTEGTPHSREDRFPLLVTGIRAARPSGPGEHGPLLFLRLPSGWDSPVARRRAGLEALGSQAMPPAPRGPDPKRVQPTRTAPSQKIISQVLACGTAAGCPASPSRLHGAEMGHHLPGEYLELLPVLLP